MGFAVPVVAFANIFHTATAVPISDHGNKRVTTLGTGQKPRITMLGLIAGSRGIPGVLFQQLLRLIPILSLDDDRIDALVPKLLRFRYCITQGDWRRAGRSKPLCWRASRSPSCPTAMWTGSGPNGAAIRRHIGKSFGSIQRSALFLFHHTIDFCAKSSFAFSAKGS